LALAPWRAGATCCPVWLVRFGLCPGRSVERSPNQLSPSTPTFFPPAPGSRTVVQHFLFCYYDSIELRPLDDLHTSIDRRLCCLFDCTQPSKTRHCLLFQAKPRCFRVSHPPVQPTLPAWPVHVPQLNEFCFATCILPIRISKQFDRISNTPRHLHRQSRTLRVTRPATTSVSRVYAGSSSFDIYPPKRPPTLQSNTFSALIL
jgi:hypothetical protein